MTDRKLKQWQRVVLWRPLRFILPTATTLYFNRHHLRGKLTTAKLPDEAWAQREANALLTRSEDRLRGLEAKGPGLATVAAVVAAGVVAAVIEGGSDATLLGKVLLGLGVWYATLSLLVPIYLVRPQPRDTIDLKHLVTAAEKDSPEQYLAVRAQEAAQVNVRRTQRIANLQDAASNELSAALAVSSPGCCSAPRPEFWSATSRARNNSRPRPGTRRRTGPCRRRRRAQRHRRRRPRHQRRGLRRRPAGRLSPAQRRTRAERRPQVRPADQPSGRGSSTRAR